MANTCGKPNCKCARGDKLKSWCLAVRDQGKRKMLHIPHELESEVFEWVKNYRELRKAMETISQANVERITLLGYSLSRCLSTAFFLLRSSGNCGHEFTILRISVSGWGQKAYRGFCHRLFFGLGFLVGGYCPGTSVAGLASGRTEALVTMIGMVAGSLAFAFLYPFMESVYISDWNGHNDTSEIIQNRPLGQWWLL